MVLSTVQKTEPWFYLNCGFIVCFLNRGFTHAVLANIIFISGNKKFVVNAQVVAAQVKTIKIICESVTLTT